MKIKKRALYGIIMICLLLVVSSVSAEAASKVKLNKTKTTIYVGSTQTLKLTGTSKKVTWSSSNKKVATVTGKGKVTARKQGSATITAKISSKKYTCKVTVKKPYLSATQKTLYVKGKTYALKLTGTKVKKYVSSNTKIATVTSKGVITAKKAGSATITCKGADGKSYRCVVKVKAHVHSWDSGIISVEPTCTTAGRKIYHCKTCSNTKSTSIKATGHTYTAANVVIDSEEAIICCAGCGEDLISVTLPEQQTILLGESAWTEVDVASLGDSKKVTIQSEDESIVNKDLIGVACGNTTVTYRYDGIVLIKGVVEVRYSLVDAVNMYTQGNEAGLAGYDEKYQHFIKAAGDVVKQNITDAMTDFEKVKAISNWMDNNLTYDESYSFYSGVDMLYYGNTGVCDAYQDVFAFFMDLFELPNYGITGDVGAPLLHAWNMVKLDTGSGMKEWYYADPTWKQYDWITPVQEYNLKNGWGVWDGVHKADLSIYGTYTITQKQLAEGILEWKTGFDLTTLEPVIYSLDDQGKTHTKVYGQSADKWSHVVCETCEKPVGEYVIMDENESVQFSYGEEAKLKDTSQYQMKVADVTGNAFKVEVENPEILKVSIPQDHYYQYTILLEPVQLGSTTLTISYNDVVVETKQITVVRNTRVEELFAAAMNGSLTDEMCTEYRDGWKMCMEQIANGTGEIQGLKDVVTENMTDYQKTKAVIDWIINSGYTGIGAYYPRPIQGYYGHSLLDGVLYQDGSGVSTAQLFSICMEWCGIDVYTIYGEQDGANYLYNAVYVDPDNGNNPDWYYVEIGMLSMDFTMSVEEHNAAEGIGVWTPAEPSKEYPNCSAAYDNETKGIRKAVNSRKLQTNDMIPDGFAGGDEWLAGYHEFALIHE